MTAAASRSASPRVPARRGEPRQEIASLALVGVIGFVVAIGAFLRGYYDLADWGPAALALLVVALALVVGRPAFSRTAAVACLSFAGLWLWSLASTGWAESAEEALLGANRWLLYTAALTAIVLLVRSRLAAQILIWSALAGILVLIGYLVVTMLGDGGRELFLARRLSYPLQYTNGLGGYLVLGFWPLVALAERGRPLALSSAAIGLATLDLSLLVLTESRGVAIAVAVSTIVLLALVPGRAMRAWVLLLCGTAVVAIGSSLLAVYDPTTTPFPTADSVRRAATLALVAAIATSGLWALVLSVRRSLDRPTREKAAQVSTWVLLALALGAVTIGAIAAPPLLRRAKAQYTAFVELKGSVGSTRLASGGGNRYDYWRIAVREFRERPVSGVGAGNYPAGYFRERRTTESIRQPHSIELQTLSELGLVGLALLAAFVAAVLAALVRCARYSRKSRGTRVLTVATGGMFVGWLVHTSGDWLHLIPSLAGVALCAAGALLTRMGSGVAPLRSKPLRIGTALACAVLAALGAVLVTRQTVADRLRADGRQQLATAPAEAIRRADQSLALDDEAPVTYYLKAAGLARLDRYREARDALLEAVRREPSDFVSWALLGDLAARRGDVPLQRRAYRRASDLNPRDPTLARLAQEATKRR